MNVSFVIPEHLGGRSFIQPPWGILLVKKLLEIDKHKVSVFDNRVLNYPIIKILQEVKFSDLIIIPTTLYDCMQHYWLDFRLHIAEITINAIKMQYPNKRVITIGSHGTVRPDLLMRDTFVDIIIKGEFEKSIPYLVSVLENKGTLEKVPNICFKNNNGWYQTEYNEDFFHPPFEEDRDYPTYNDINFNSYYHDIVKNNIHKKGRKWGVLIASKGCTFKCSFCYNFFSSKIRRRTPESIVSEMEILENKYTLEGVYILDSTFTLNPQWVFKICKLIKQKGLKIKWGFETRCDLLPIELLKEVKSANCSRILLGIESFSDVVLKRVEKGFTSNEILTGLANIKLVELEVLAFINIGLPGETIETLQTTIENIHAQKLFYTKSIIVAQPKFGTRYYEIAKAQYPDIGNNWSDLLSIAGLIGNEMTPLILERTINLLKSRDFIYSKKCPNLRKLLS